MQSIFFIKENFRYVLAGILLIALTILASGCALTGEVVGNDCSGSKDYYLCIDGEGDFVLNDFAVPLNEINETINDYRCKLVTLAADESFIFRYANSAIKGIVYNSNKEQVGENINQHAVANYKCSLNSDCGLSCSEYKIW